MFTFKKQKKGGMQLYKAYAIQKRAKFQYTLLSAHSVMYASMAE